MKKLFTVLLGALLTIGAAAPVFSALPVINADVVHSPDGTLDGHFLAGDKPPQKDALEWDIGGELAAAGWDDLRVGTPKCTDVRQFLSGTFSGANDSGLTLLTVDGTAPGAAGITITSTCGPPPGSGLTYDGAGVGLGSFRIVATEFVSGDVAQSAVKTYQATNPISPPAAPTGLQAQVDSTTQITVSWPAVAGATLYTGRRGGANICVDVSVPQCVHTGLTADTQYTFDAIAKNTAGSSPDSADITARTNAVDNPTTLDPNYPRKYLRQALSNMHVLDPDNNLADFNLAKGWWARYESSMGGSGRNKTYAGGSINPSNLIQTLKLDSNYDSSRGGSAHCKYTNVTQLDQTAGEDAQARGKAGHATSQNNGEGGAWHLRKNNNALVVDAGHNKFKMNYSTFLTADQNGLKWHSWYPSWEFSKTTDTKTGPGGTFTGANFGVGMDFVASQGFGLKESAYDCTFEDDMAMLSGDAATFLNCSDFDEDEDTDAACSGSSGDSIATPAIKDAMTNGFLELKNKWFELFATQSPRTLRYHIGNITALSAWNDIWPLNIRGNAVQGGLVEELTGKSKTKGFGNYTTHDNATPLSDGTPSTPYSGVLGQYRRAMDYSAAPKIVAIGHEPEPEWRDKWGCKPGALDVRCNSATKTNNWISEGGTCVEGDGVANGVPVTPGQFCKYPGRWQDFSDYRLLRWALAFVMMDDGYISVNQTTDTWNTGLPWFDEYIGGSQKNTDGWCGQPLTNARGAVQRAAWDDGVWMREFDNCIVFHNPMRGEPNVEHTKTVDLPAAGAGFRWKHLCATPGGFITDGRPGLPTTDDNASGTQDNIVNDGSWVGTENQSGLTIQVRQVDGVFLWRAPVGTPQSCP